MVWNTPNNGWDDVWIGEDLLPGVGQITGGIGVDLDDQKASGSDGSTSEDKGIVVDDIVLTQQFTANMLPDLKGILDKIRPQEGRKRSPQALTNVVANAMGVYAVKIKHIGFPTVSGGLGSIQITMVKHHTETPNVPPPGAKVGTGGPGSDLPSVEDSFNEVLLS
jgi:hypothetical protein